MSGSGLPPEEFVAGGLVNDSIRGRKRRRLIFRELSQHRPVVQAAVGKIAMEPSQEERTGRCTREEHKAILAELEKEIASRVETPDKDAHPVVLPEVEGGNKDHSKDGERSRREVH